MGDLGDGEAFGAAAGVVAGYAGEAGVDDEADAGDGEGGFGDVGGEDEFSLGGGLEDALLVGVGEAAEAGDDFEAAAEAVLEEVHGFADVFFGGEEGEDVAGGAELVLYPLGGFGDAFEVGVVAGVFEELVEGGVDDVDGVDAAGDFDDGGVVEGGGEFVGVDGGGGDDDLEIGSAGAELVEVAEEEVDVEGALVGFVDDDGVVVAHEGVGVDLGEEHAVGHEFDAGLFGGLVGEADLGSDFLAELDAELFGDAFGYGEGGDAAGLGAGDLFAGAGVAGVEQHLGDLCGLAGAGFAGEDDGLVRLDCGYNLVAPLGDGEFRRVVDLGEGIGEICGIGLWVSLDH